MKATRQRAILDIITRTPVSSQGEIVSALAQQGIATNQGTVSRDIQDLGLVKVPGPGRVQHYALPGAATPRRRGDLAAVFKEHVRTVDGNDALIVVRTPPGHAHLVAVALDALEDSAIVGTVAGDDTVLVVPRTARDRRALMTRFHALLAGPRR